LISVFRTFRIFLDRQYNTPYESLYIQAMLPSEDRDLIKQILQNQDVIPPSILYRKNDPYFGVADDVRYVHAFSVNSASLEQYVTALGENHFRKRLILGPLKTAQALDADDNVVYEVVYSEIVDTGVNQSGESPPQTVSTAFPITVDGSTTSTVYPNSLINMRDRVIDTVGQTNTVLPLWMTSKQANGKVLGFTRAWVVAYTVPGESARLAYSINEQFENTLNTIDFDVDRYILDRSMTKNWVPNEDSTDGGSWLPAKQTTFDFDEVSGPDSTVPETDTTFDADSLRFISPVDNYEFTDEYNKYLVFPKYNILGSKADAQHNTGDSILNGGVSIDENLSNYGGPWYLFGTSASGFTQGTEGFYYPLYTDRSLADAADDGTGSSTLGNGTSHIHTFDEFPGIIFYMPNSSMNHGTATQPDLPEYIYRADLAPSAPDTPTTTIVPESIGYSVTPMGVSTGGSFTTNTISTSSSGSTSSGSSSGSASSGGSISYSY